MEEDKVRCPKCKSEDIKCLYYDDDYLIENCRCNNCDVKFEVQYALKVISTKEIN